MIGAGARVGGALSIAIGVQAEAATHRPRIERFIRDYLGDEDRPVPFGGRDDAFALLDGWLADTAAEPNLLLTAPAAGGKSALLVRWIDRLAVQPSDWHVVFVPISLRYETNRPEVFFAALCAALSGVRGLPLAAAPVDPTQFYRDKVIELLDAWPAAGPRCLLVIDGLDEATGWKLDTTVLPPRPRAGLRLVLSARDMAHCDAEGWIQQIRWDPRRNPVRRMALGALRREAVEPLLVQAVPALPAALRAGLADELFRLSEGDPLLVQLYISGFQAELERGGTLDLVALRQSQAGFKAFFTDWIDQQRKVWESPGRPFDESLVKSCMALLAEAAGPLRHDDLQALLPRMPGTQTVFDGDSLRPVQRFIVGDGTVLGYSFAHPKFGIHVREVWLGQGPWLARASQALLTWGEGIAEDLVAARLTPEAVPGYVLNFHASHLARAQRPLAEWQALGSEGWRLAWEAAEEGTSGFARDAMALLQRAREACLAPTALGGARDGDRPEALATLLHAALILGSIRARGSKVSARVLQAAVLTGALTFRAAAQLARLRADPDERAKSLCELVACAPEAQRSLLIEQAMAAARTIPAPDRRDAAWRRAAALLPEAERLRRFGPWQVEVPSPEEIQGQPERLAEVAPYISSGALEQAAAELFAASDGRSVWVVRHRIDALVAYMTPALADAAMRAQWEVEGLNLHLGMRPAILERMSPDGLSRAIEVLTGPAAHLTASNAAAMGVIARRLDAAGRTALRSRIVQRWARDGVLPHVRGLPDGTADRRANILIDGFDFTTWLAQLPCDEESGSTVLLLMPLLDLDEARRALSFLARTWGTIENLTMNWYEALAATLPPELAWEYRDLWRAHGDPLQFLAPLVSRMPDASAHRLVESLMEHASAAARDALIESCPDKVPLKLVQQAIAQSLGIEDQLDLMGLEHAAWSLLPEDRPGIERRLVAIASAMVAPFQLKRALVMAAPFMTPSERSIIVRRVFEGQPESAFAEWLEVVEPCLDESMLEELLPWPGEAQRVELALCKVLGPRFAAHPRVAARLEFAVSRAVPRLVPGRSDRELEAEALQSLLPWLSADALQGIDEHLARNPRLTALELRASRLLAHTDLQRARGPLLALVSLCDQGTDAQRAVAIAASATVIGRWPAEELIGPAHDLLAAALSIQELPPRIGSLVALLRHRALPRESQALAAAELLRAIDALKPPVEQAQACFEARDVVEPARLNEVLLRLVAAIEAMPELSERMQLALNVLRCGPCAPARQAFVSQGLAFLGSQIPDLGLEYRDDLQQVLDIGADHADIFFVAETEGQAALGRRMAEHVSALAPPDRWRLLVHGATSLAFAARGTQLHILQVFVEPLHEVGGAALVRRLLGSAREVSRWYP